MKKERLYCLVAGLLLSGAASAFEPFVIQDIRIEGLERIGEGTVLNYLPVKAGDPLSESETPNIMKALFKTGFFNNIQLDRDGRTLVVVVSERPSIGKIEITGNRDIKTEDLLKGLKSAGLSEGRTFDKALLDQTQQELQRQYFSRGKYAVHIETIVKNEARNRVSIQIIIHEGRAAKIREIALVGNHRFSDRVLKKQMQLSSSNFLSWINKDDQYAKQKLVGDRESIRSYYLDRGYLNFDLSSTQVAITPDKKDIYITLNLKEGELYTVSGLSLEGRFVVPKEELLTLMKVKEGDVFSRSKVTESINAISDRLGEEGYAFAKIGVDPVVHQEGNKVDLVLTLDPGQRYYARRIYFVGNVRTKDVVLRRSVSQLEGAWVSSKRIKESQEQLNRTGYFSDVQVDVQPVPGTLDQVDITYGVKETSSGQVSGSIGYSDLDGLLFQFGVSNHNFIGTGNTVNFVFNNSHSSTTYSVGYVNPFYTTHGVSRGFNLFYNETDLSNTTNIANYATDNWGGNLESGIPYSNLTRLNFGLGYNFTKLLVNQASAPGEIIGFIDKHGQSYQEFDASLSWVYNSLDRYVFPDKGLRYSFGANGSIPTADLQYYRMTADTQWFYPLWRGYIFSANGSLGFGSGYGKTDELPFYKNYFAGGARSIRGYGESSLGPRDSQGNPFGGNLKMEGSVGIVLPNFIAPESKAVRTQVFFDAGQVYDTRPQKRLANGLDIDVKNPAGLRYSTGVSLTWMSPLAPLVFSYAIPLKSKGDEEQRFSFTFATFF